MSERPITAQYLREEFAMLGDQILTLKRICFDHYGHTREGYEAHAICSNIEPMLASAAALISKAGAQ